jgi:putative redox protein
MRHHRLVVDEPDDLGGADEGPSPQELLAASLAACTAITLEMYAERKGWDLTGIEVECEYAPAERGAPTHVDVTLRLPDGLSPEQVERLRVIAAKCPVHRTLAGEVVFHERIEVAAAADAG